MISGKQTEGGAAGSTPAGTQPTRLIKCSGPFALRDSAAWLDRVHDIRGVPLLARRKWLQSWLDAFSCWDPWVLTLIEGGQATAVAPLARRRTRLGLDVVSIGNDALMCSPLAACSDAAATGLAAAILDALQELRTRWTLRVRQLPQVSPLTSALRARLPNVELLPGNPRPVLRFNDDRPPAQWLSRNTASAVAKARNRIKREGHRLELEWLVAWDAIKTTLPELVRVHRERDLELRGQTLLDDPRQAMFYDAIIARHVDLWRLLAVRIDGSLAGYALCLQDGGELRVWDNRVSPAWARYSAGLIANAELVQLAAVDPSVTTLDWGCGEQRYKRSLSNELIDAQILTAWSSPMLRAARAAGRKLAAQRRLVSLGR
jgi:CelD/BcsL family acetyltransferase involved in cellulose biosynthesis